jgi:glycine/D-amino acid oxidase-like deaminating enzyme
MTRIAVIGAGITGVTAESSLMDRGYDVALFDSNRYAAMQTSFVNGGQLSASNAETWNRWSTAFKRMKWVMTRDGVVAQIICTSECDLPEAEFRRCVQNWGGQVRSSG